MNNTLVAAKINTKSNYRNLNGTFQQVIEMVEKRVTCRVQVDGKMQTIDFDLSEITEFRYNSQAN